MLSDIEARKPKPAPCKLSDERGLYLLVNPNGGKLWRMNYRFEGRQKTLAFGAYPDVSLCRCQGQAGRSQEAACGGNRPERAAEGRQGGGNRHL
jgi:hypothetical protein